MVDAEGGVWVCDNGKDVSVSIMDPANPSADFKPVFAEGTRDEEGVKTVDGTAIHGKIAAFCLTGSGEDTKLYTMDNSLAVNGATLNILQYNIGSLDAPYALPYDAIAYDNSTGKYANSDLAIVSDKTQGVLGSPKSLGIDVLIQLFHISVQRVIWTFHPPQKIFRHFPKMFRTVELLL